ncbi:MAG: hypothetical protein II694_10770 [Lachnospiraceae bacterium]|jgi:hypothetical protein|nr:hypothetical protein [Lachnospiraceae bacterium]
MRLKSIERYCRKIKRKLVGSKRTKEMLVNGLRNEIESKVLPENVTVQWLEDEIGTISETAEELQYSVAIDEYHRAKRDRLVILLTTVFLVAGSLFIGFKWYVNYVRENEVGYVETIIVVEGEDDEFISTLPEITDVDYSEATSIE